MKNYTILKGLVLNNVLTTSEMMLVKGGTSGPGQSGQNSTNADDKRRERPGGGVSNR